MGNNFVISPNPPAAGFRLCGEVSVLTFNAPGGQSVLGAEIARTDFGAGAIGDGWANVSTPGLNTGIGGFPAEFGAVNPPGGHGLPIIGKAFTRAGNGTVSANFGASWEHRYSVALGLDAGLNTLVGESGKHEKAGSDPRLF